MWIWITFGGVLWIACSVLEYGLYFAYYQRKWPSIANENRLSDRFLAALIALIGPIGLLATLITGQFGYGLQYRNNRR